MSVGLLPLRLVGRVSALGRWPPLRELLGPTFQPMVAYRSDYASAIWGIVAPVGGLDTRVAR